MSTPPTTNPPTCPEHLYPAPTEVGGPECLTVDPCLAHEPGSNEGSGMWDMHPCTLVADRPNAVRDGCGPDTWPLSGDLGAACVPYDPCVPSNGVDGPGWTMWDLVGCEVQVATSAPAPTVNWKDDAGNDVVTSYTVPADTPVQELPVTGGVELAGIALAGAVLIAIGLPINRRMFKRQR